MIERKSYRLVWVIAWICVGITLVAVAFSPSSGLSPWDGFRPHEVIIGTLFPLIGALIISRERGNVVGRVMIVAGVSWGLDFAVTTFAWYGGVTHIGTPGAGLATWMTQWGWMPGSAFIFVFLLLLFPDGHLPSPRWRPLPWLAGAALLFAILGSAVAAWPHRNQIEFLTTSNVNLTGAAAAIGTVGFLVVVLSALPAALNNIAKYAEATEATVALGQEDGHLTFSVTDDGKGFDTDTNRHGTGLQGMADRLDAVGGSLDVASRPGAGTKVSGRIPLPAPTNGAARS